jgi:hypothetical protein
MPKSTENWSEQRRIMAPRVASILYGVIAIITVDLAADPADRPHYGETAFYVLLVGLAMTMTLIFVKMVTKEAELGAHVSIRTSGEIVRDASLVMAFPVLTAIEIVAAALATARWPTLLDFILYEGFVAVFLIGFLSSYILDRDIKLGLQRGGTWIVLLLALVAVKKLT